MTVSGGPARLDPSRPLDPQEQDGPGRRPGAGAAALVVGAVAVLAAAVAVGPTEPATPPALAVEVRVIDEQVSNSQSGVLVVPLEVVNRGPGVTVDSTVTWAEPVRQKPATTGNRQVAAGGTGRIVALLQPDCAMLSPSPVIPFVATLVVRVQGAEQQSLDLRVDLEQVGAVTTRVTAYCRATR